MKKPTDHARQEEEDNLDREIPKAQKGMDSEGDMLTSQLREGMEPMTPHFCLYATQRVPSSL